MPGAQGYMDKAAFQAGECYFAQMAAQIQSMIAKILSGCVASVGGNSGGLNGFHYAFHWKVGKVGVGAVGADGRPLAHHAVVVRQGAVIPVDTQPLHLQAVDPA